MLIGKNQIEKTNLAQKKGKKEKRNMQNIQQIKGQTIRG